MTLLDPHPPLTTFPAALISVVCALEIYSFFRPAVGVRTAIRVNLWFALVGTIAAFFSGYIAGSDASAQFGVSQDLVSVHHGWGRGVLFLMIPCVALEVIARRAVRARGWFVGGYRVFLFSAFLAMVQTCYLGGVLVFEHGVGVRKRVERPLGDRAESTTSDGASIERATAE